MAKFVSGQDEANPCSIGYSERALTTHLALVGFPTLVPQKRLLFGHISNKSFVIRLDIGLNLPLRAFWPWSITSHLTSRLTRLVYNAYLQPRCQCSLLLVPLSRSVGKRRPHPNRAINCASRKTWFQSLHISCENTRFSSLFADGNVSRGGTSVTQRQKFHIHDVKSVRNLVRSADWSSE